MRPGRLRQRDRGARRAAEGDQRLELGEPDAAGVAGGAHEVHDVVHHLLVHVEIGDRRARREDGARLEQPLDRDLLAAAHPQQHFLLLVAGWDSPPAP